MSIKITLYTFSSKINKILFYKSTEISQNICLKYYDQNQKTKKKLFLESKSGKLSTPLGNRIVENYTKIPSLRSIKILEFLSKIKP